MAECYILENHGLRTTSKHMSSLVKVDPDKAQNSSLPVVAVLDGAEFEGLGLEDPNAHESLTELASSESTYVDIYPEYIVGSLAVPSKTDFVAEPSLFAFYLDDHMLIFVHEGNTAHNVLKRVIDIGVLSETTPAHCLYVFFKELLVNDLAFLGDFEDKMETIEERMMGTGPTANVHSNVIMSYRRQSMRFGVYYQEMATMAGILGDDENELMSQTDAHAFDHIEALADRLATRSSTLKEYSLQLHELQQTQIDLKQNSIMQIFTIVTVLFAPLTLVTGWFGMNLQTLPGLDFPAMWACLVGGALLCTGLLLAFFRWKKWL